MAAAAFAALCLFSCVKEISNADTNLPAEDNASEAEAPLVTKGMINGAVIVKFDDNMLNLIESDVEEGHIVTKSSELNAALKDLGIVSLARVIPYDAEFE